MAIDVGTIMDAIGTALATISGLNVFDYPPMNAQTPFAMVDIPEEIEYDLTMGRGFDRMTIPVLLVVGAQDPMQARDDLCTYAAASGASSVKAVLDAASIGSDVRVTRASFQPIDLNDVIHPYGIRFTVDVKA